MDKIQVELTENEDKMMQRVSEITNTDYDIKYNYVSVDSLLVAIEDLLTEYEYLKEQHEDLERDVRDNYEPISVREQINYNENW